MCLCRSSTIKYYLHFKIYYVLETYKILERGSSCVVGRQNGAGKGDRRWEVKRYSSARQPAYGKGNYGENGEVTATDQLIKIGIPKT
jgi:hypothetical protein